MGGKKRKKAQSTDTSGTDLDTSDMFSTAEHRRSMKVSDSIMERLKNIEEKMDKNQLFLTQKIVEEVEKLRSEVFELSRLNDSLTERLHKFERKCEALQEDVTTLRNSLVVERESRNDLEQYGRRENRFVKLGPDSSSETTTQREDQALAIINEKLKLEHITKQHISVARRVGQFSKGYQRQVIVRSVSRRHRIEVIQARRNLKGSGIAIVEDLTPLNKERLDRVSKHKAVRSTWTKDGRIFALLADKRVVKIEKGDLSKLPQRFTCWQQPQRPTPRCPVCVQ